MSAVHDTTMQSIKYVVPLTLLFSFFLLVTPAHSKENEIEEVFERISDDTKSYCNGSMRSGSNLLDCIFSRVQYITVLTFSQSISDACKDNELCVYRAYERIELKIIEDIYSE